jgi:Copper type II ascorbate-dependent monooxygenase, C-terminal domain
MPPWHADPRYGRFSNDRSLSERERSTLLAWVDQGRAAGDLSTAPKPPELPQGWSIGTPDLVFELPETFKVPAEGTVPIIHYRIPSNLEEDIWIQAAEARPSDRAVVHHIFVYTEKYVSNFTRQKEKTFLAAYLPGDVLSVYPPGVGKKIPAGADLVFEVHYAPIGTIRYDRSSIGIIISKAPSRHLAITRGIAAHGLRIPPGASDHVERAEWTVPQDIHILSFSPHMHLRGKSFLYKAHYPGGETEVVLSVPNYDFAWQSVYRLVEPKALPRGTKIYCEAHYDNSSRNNANPDPARTVTWGEQTQDEMMMGYLDYYVDTPIAADSAKQGHGR